MVSLTSTVPFASQVGGHQGVSTTEDGSMLIKPVLAREVEFYQTLISRAELAALRQFVPKFFGTLRLQGRVEDVNQNEVALKALNDGVEEDKDESQNLANSFLKPNILDIKLGRVLYDDEATPEKKERMEEKARESTSYEKGVKITGFQVHDNKTGEALHTRSLDGISLTAADLPDGIAKFFPVASKESTVGLPKDVLLQILQSIRRNVSEIRDVVESIEFRMIGGSLLMIYEADLERAKGSLASMASGSAVSADGPENDDDDDDDDVEDDEQEEEEEEEESRLPYVVKLIDFAHTKLVPGQGPDQGVLFGIDTTLKLLDGRIAQISNGL